MKRTLTTHKGDTFLLIEVPLDADKIFNSDYRLFYSIWNDKRECSEMQIVKLSENKNDTFELIGTTSTLTNEQVEPFVEQIIYVVKPYKRNTYHSYTNEYDTLNTALESWDSFLKANNIDTTKNYCVLKLLND